MHDRLSRARAFDCHLFTLDGIYLRSDTVKDDSICGCYRAYTGADDATVIGNANTRTTNTGDLNPGGRVTGGQAPPGDWRPQAARRNFSRDVGRVRAFLLSHFRSLRRAPCKVRSMMMLICKLLINVCVALCVHARCYRSGAVFLFLRPADYPPVPTQP